MCNFMVKSKVYTTTAANLNLWKVTITLDKYIFKVLSAHLFSICIKTNGIVC